MSTSAFDQFWARYPRRVARKDAQKAWAQVNADDALGAILDALAWQATQPAWTKDDGAFVPYPATWLRGERWTDERPMTADERAERANYEAWRAQNAHDPTAATVTFEAFQHYQRARRRA